MVEGFCSSDSRNGNDGMIKLVLFTSRMSCHSTWAFPHYVSNLLLLLKSTLSKGIFLLVILLLITYYTFFGYGPISHKCLLFKNMQTLGNLIHFTINFPEFVSDPTLFVIPRMVMQQKFCIFFKLCTNIYNGCLHHTEAATAPLQQYWWTFIFICSALASKKQFFQHCFTLSCHHRGLVLLINLIWIFIVSLSYRNKLFLTWQMRIISLTDL